MAFIATTHAPDCNVVFYPFAKEQTGELGEADKLTLRFDDGLSAQRDIIKCQTTKPKGSVGTFSVLLGSNRNWKSLLQPGCWCMIYMSDFELTGKETAELDSGLKMFGIVRSIRRIEDQNNATSTKTVRYLITGEDFHHVFNTPIYLNVHLGKVGEGSGSSMRDAILTLSKDFNRALGPSEMVKAFIQSLLGKPFAQTDKTNATIAPAFQTRGGQAYQVPIPVARRILGKNATIADDNFFTSLVNLFFQDDLFGKATVQSELGDVLTVWSMIQTYCHRLVNEIYTELLPKDIKGETRLVPSVVLRSIPFSEDRSVHKSQITMLDALIAPGAPINSTKNTKTANADPPVPANTAKHFYVSKQIGEHELISFNSGKSDAERFNLFYIVPTIIPNNAQINDTAFLDTILQKVKGFDKIGDKISNARYGLKPMIAHSDYLVQSEKDVIGTANLVVQSIWRKAYLFENGHITLIGSKQPIPVGTNFLLTERGWMGHIEQVSNEFAVVSQGDKVMKTFTTSIAFSRLQNKDGTPIDLTEHFDDSGQLGDWDRGVSGTLEIGGGHI